MDVEQCNLAKDFTRQLEKHLGLEHSKVSFKEEWLREPPDAASGLSLDNYILEACLLSSIPYLQKTVPNVPSGDSKHVV